MTNLKTALPDYLKQDTTVGDEITVTGKWVATQKSRFFKKSNDYKEMLEEWKEIHQEARAQEGVLNTEINPALAQDAVLIHHTFRDEEAFLEYFKTTAEHHIGTLKKVAKPEIQLIRGTKIDTKLRKVLSDKSFNANFGEYLFGYVKNENERPAIENAVQVTAKWTCKDAGTIEELIHWWQQVGTDAYSMEEGLVRFEVYQVIGENALIIHETFKSSDDLKFHLTKGTAEKYKKDIDKIAFPENYFFRGPVAWLIRTYSKFMHLPATYTGQGMHYSNKQGSLSEGFITNNNNMKNQEVMVVYSWTAKEGKSNELKEIYTAVTQQMKSNEPGALNVQCYFDESTSRLIVKDIFADAGAVGFHLGTTAAGHFENLLAIANPGEFLFCGNVPDEMKAAAKGMGLNATFAPVVFGFDRA